MKEIKLSQQGKNKGRFVALVDDEDFEYLNQWKWYAHKGTKTLYAARWDSLRKHIRMHRIIMNTPNDMEVDHIDHNGLNCQRKNMRNSSIIQNRRNKSSHSKSGFLGVSLCRNSIRARIYLDGKDQCLGYYKNKEDAAKAYDIAAKKYFGEFANLNFKD